MTEMNSEHTPVAPEPPAPGKNRLPLIIGSIVAALVILALVLVLVLGGKDDEDKDNSPSDKTPTPTEAISLAPSETPTPTATSAPTATPTPTDAPLTAIGKHNPLHIDTYEYYSEGQALNDAGDVLLLATIDPDSKIGKRYIDHLVLLQCDETGAVCYYVLRNTPRSSEYTNDYESVEDEELTLYLTRLNGDDLTDDTVLFDYEGVLLQPNANGVILTQYRDNSHLISLLDHNLQEVRTYSIDQPCNDPYFSADGTRGYYVRTEPYEQLHALDANGNDRMITIDNYLVSYLQGVVTDSKGTDYLLMTALAADQEFYSLVVNAETAEVLYVSKPNYSYVRALNNFYVEVIFDADTYQNTRWIIGNEEFTTDFRSNDAHISYNHLLLDNGDIMFVTNDGDSSELFLYDSKTGVLKDSTDITIPHDITTTNEFMEYSIYLSDYKLLSENTLLLIYNDESNKQYYCTWTVDGVPTVESHITGSEYEMGSRPSLEVDHTIDINDFTPGELSPELLPLKQQADALGDLYGISIYIGEECANIIGGYTITPLTDYAEIETALSVLQTELAKYPTGFFQQMLPEYLNENAIYLTDDLIYIGDDLRSSTAGGFRTDHDGQQLLVLDCVGTGITLETTLHHELSHVIDDFVLRTCAEEGLTYFTEEGWLALNPPQDIYGDLYSYTYSKYGTTEFLYTNAYLLGEDVSNSYFVDGYATTYPTEDRARIWEYVMCDESALDFSAAPHLETKLNYYIAAIHEAFDTSLWPEELYWEQNK